jgi:hypothetical protein
MAVTNSYAELTHLQAVIGGLFTIGTGTKPSISQCEVFLDQTAADLDGLLKDRGYSVPATGTTDILILQKYTSLGAAVLTINSAFGHDDEPDNVTAWREEFETFKEQLAEGKRRLVDQNPTARIGVVRSKRFVSST